MMKISVIFILLICLYLNADPFILNFDDFSAKDSAKHSSLLSLQGHIIQMRGFWYPLSANEGILAPQPDLRSCCLKVPDKIHQQLLVRGRVETHSFQKAVTIEGIFKIESRYNEEGKLIQLFILEQAREVAQSEMYSSIMILCFLTILVAFSLFFLRDRYQKSGDPLIF